MELNYKLLGDKSQAPIVILHGLFGMLDNWQSIGRKLSEQYAVWLIDQRNHGKSPHSLEQDYYLLSDDLRQFMEQHQIGQLAGLIGHSMGGKVAMRFAVEHGALVEKLIIADIAPKAYPAQGHDDIFRALFQIDLSKIQSRADAELALQSLIPEAAVYQFILKNLSRNSDGSYAWKFNFEAIYYNYAEIIANPLTKFDHYDKATLFLRGGNSPNYIQLPQDETLIQQYFPKARIETIENAGHWLHADQPDAFLAAVHRFLHTNHT
jgi:esterase